MPLADNLEQRNTMKKQNIKGQFASKTDIGCVRVTNEDQAVSLINSSGNVLLCVCDGMGGHNKGDYASKLAIDIISEEFRNKSGFFSLFTLRHWIGKVFRRVNNQIYEEAQSDPKYKDMGTTINMVILYGDSVVVANAGDSRAYAVKRNKLQRLSEDQTYVEYLYRTGKISEEEMETSSQRHILMNAIGSLPSASYDIKTYTNLSHSILVCTDGLYNNASEEEIHRVLSSRERIDQKLDTLIEVAKSNGGSDNIGISYWEASNND